MNIKEYLLYEKKTLTSMAKDLMMSRTHLGEVARGNLRPSRRLAMYIEKYTEGKVTAKELLDAWEEKNNISSNKSKENDIDLT